MSFEIHSPIFDGGKEGHTLRAHGKGMEVCFSTKPEKDTDYRLFVVGETAQFYHWKNEPDGQYLYRSLSDALDTAHAIRDQYCLDLSCKQYKDYLKRVYKKVLWPPKETYVGIHDPKTDWKFGLTVTAKNLTFKKNGFLQMRVDVRLKKEGVHPHSVLGDPDYSLTLPIPAGSYAGKVLSMDIEIPQSTANVAVFVEGVGYRGQCFVESPFLCDGEHQLLPCFAQSVQDKPDFDWSAQYLSRKEWPEFRVRLNGRVVFSGEVFERVHRRAEWEIPLPAAHIRAENTLSLELISDYHDPLPYTVHEMALLTKSAAPLSLLSVSEVASVGRGARVLLRTDRPNMRIKLHTESAAISGKAEYVFKEKGLHGILLDCHYPANGASFTLTADGITLRGEVPAILQRQEDRVITGTGDMIYIHQDLTSMENYLSWYISNHVGDLVTIRPTYRWSGTRTINPAVWRAFTRLMRELSLKYVLMVDGREVPGLSTQPDNRLLAGKGFLGRQMHERDGAEFYWGNWRSSSATLTQGREMFWFASNENPRYTSARFFSPSHYHYRDNFFAYFVDKENEPRDAAIAHERSVKHFKDTKMDFDTRHTGPSCTFKYLAEGGYTFLGAETMYSTMEPLLAFLRGVAKDRHMKTFGVHHAVQWSAPPHDVPERYRRYRLALYASYLLGATDINTEEGLWRLEEHYAYFHRFSEACRAHLKEHQDFYRYISSHSRTGEFYTPFAIIHGRDDGVTFFGKNKTWGHHEPQSEAEDSWDLLAALYPGALPVHAVDRMIPAVKEPRGYHTGTPMGQLDIIPAEAGKKTVFSYRSAAFLGYNHATEADMQKLLSFARRGGRLLLTRAHLSKTTDLDAIKNGALEFDTLPLSFTEGEPVFAPSSFGGVSLPVCTNALPAEKVLCQTDDGLPLLCLYRVGKGEVLLFNTPVYPAHGAICERYKAELAELMRKEVAREEIWAEVGDDMEFAVYRQEDGSRHLYFLAVDYFNDPAPLRRGTLRLGKDRYEVALPFGVLAKCVVRGNAAAMAEGEAGEVLSVTEDVIRVQGTGRVPFRLFKNGKTHTVTVDFTQNPTQTILWQA